MEYIKKREYVDRNLIKPFPGKYGVIDLSRMLTYPRPAGSKMEEKYINKFIDIVPDMRIDEYGNRYVSIGKHPSTLFASHTDTVHTPFSKYKWVYDNRVKKFEERKTKVKERHQNIIMGGKWVRGSGGDVLGADDTTGNWLMLNLIAEKKPGLYIFHRKEESGRGGSEWIAKNKPEMVKNIKRAVAFDRKGYQDIITHQMGERTASDKFAKELARRLGSGYRPDPTGSYTDTLSYAHLVPECTNISVGYKGAHTYGERQNLKFAKHLYGRLRDVNFETLPVARKPERKKAVTWLEWSPHETDYYGKWQDEYQKQYGLNKKQLRYQEKLDRMQERIDRLYDITNPKTTEEEDNMFEEANRLAQEKSMEYGIKKLFGEPVDLVNDDEIYDYVYKNLKKKKKEGVIE